MAKSSAYELLRTVTGVAVAEANPAATATVYKLPTSNMPGVEGLEINVSGVPEAVNVTVHGQIDIGGTSKRVTLVPATAVATNPVIKIPAFPILKGGVWVTFSGAVTNGSEVYFRYY